MSGACECNPAAPASERCSKAVIRCNAGLAAWRDSHGICSSCGWTKRLKKDGTVRSHFAYHGRKRWICRGVGKPPTVESGKAAGQ